MTQTPPDPPEPPLPPSDSGTPTTPRLPGDPGYPIDVGGGSGGPGLPTQPDGEPGAGDDDEAGMGRSYRRRRGLFGVGVIAVVALLVGGVVWLRGGRDDERSPEDTVRLFFDASMDQDCEHLVDLVVERSWSQDGTVDKNTAVDQCNADLAVDTDFDAELHDVEVTSEKDDTAVVEVRYSLEGDDIDTSLDLEKEDGTWKVTNT